MPSRSPNTGSKKQTGDPKIKRETLVNYSLAMSQIVKKGDVSNDAFDDDDRKMIQEMSNGKTGSDLNQILNSAIAQHAIRSDTP